MWKECDKKRVLFLSFKDMAGSGVKLSKALDAHSEKYQSRFVSLKRANFGAENDIVCPSLRDIQHMIKGADIIHLKGDTPPQAYKVKFGGKAVFQTVGGSNFRKMEEGYFAGVATGKFSHDKYEQINISGITPELTDIWIPHAIEVKRNEWKKPTGKIRIGHSPSHRAKKGTELLLDVIQEFDNVELVLMENMTNEDVLKVKKTLHLFVDQLIIKAYGMSAVECLAMGIPVVSSCLPLSGCPVYRVDSYTKGSLKKALQKAISELSEKTSKAAFDWAKKTHSYEAVCRKLEEFYTLENKTFIMKKVMTEVEFIQPVAGMELGTRKKMRPIYAKKLVEDGVAKLVVEELKKRQTRKKNEHPNG